jgi:hypothetical protein
LESQKKAEEKKKLDAIKSIKMVIERPKKIPTVPWYQLDGDSLDILETDEYFNDILINGYV